MKWFALGLTFALGGWAWWQIPQLPTEHRDLPPLHVLVLIPLAGCWTACSFDIDRRQRGRRDEGSGDD